MPFIDAEPGAYQVIYAAGIHISAATKRRLPVQDETPQFMALSLDWGHEHKRLTHLFHTPEGVDELVTAIREMQARIWPWHKSANNPKGMETNDE